MKLMGDRTDDVEAFRRGSENGTLDLSGNTDPTSLRSPSSTTMSRRS